VNDLHVLLSLPVLTQNQHLHLWVQLLHRSKMAIQTQPICYPYLQPTQVTKPVVIIILSYTNTNDACLHIDEQSTLMYVHSVQSVTGCDMMSCHSLSHLSHPIRVR
jgi:hypothetical protein